MRSDLARESSLTPAVSAPPRRRGAGWLLLAALAFVAIGALWIVTDRRAAERVYDDFSSANTSDRGVSQASSYLARRGRTSMLTRPLGRDPIEPDAVVLRLTTATPLLFDPEDLGKDEVGPPRPRERPLLTNDEDAFVRRGGRILIGTHQGVLPTTTPPSKTAVKVFPVWPGVETLAVAEATSALFALRPRMHAVFTAGDRVILARERIGDGDVFVLTWPEIFQNANVAKEDHLALLTALVGKRPVYFDEVPHGIVSSDGALALMADWNLGPFLIALLAIAVLVFWRGSRRVGPPEEEHRETRSEAVDLVRSLAALYGDVTPRQEALALYYDALTRTVAHTTGLRGDALRLRVSELTAGRRSLDAINDAFSQLSISKTHLLRTPKRATPARAAPSRL